MELKRESIIYLTESPEEIENLRNRNKKMKEANTNFIKIFRPIFYGGVMFCLKKYSIKEDRFTLNSNLYLLPCLLPTLFLLVLSVMILKDFELTFVSQQFVKYMYAVIYLQYIVQCVILCAVQFLLKSESLKLISTLQEVYAFLYIKRDVLKLKSSLLLPCILYTLTYCTLISMKLTADPDWSWYRGVFTYITLLFDYEMIFASFILYFLAYNTKRWTQTVQNIDVLITASTGGAKILENLSRVFEKIIYAVGLMQTVFKVMILYHMVTSFTQTLCYIQILILWKKSPLVDAELMLTRAVGVLLWITKGFALDSALCFCSDKLYRRLESAKHVVISKFNQEDLKSTRKFAKNIVRVCDTKFTKVNACGVFTVDAALPLRLAGVVATYTIVLLQFAFL